MTEREWKRLYVLTFLASRAAGMLDCAEARQDLAALASPEMLATARALANAAWAAAQD